MSTLKVAPVTLDEQMVAALASIHIEAVADNAGVSFMHPLAPEKAMAFWRASLERASSGKKIVFGAFDEVGLSGTVTLVLDMPENQPHRAEIAKMMVARRARRQGVATKLLEAAETEARNRGCTLLMLDTVKDSAASRIYTRLGWIRFGDVPGHALLPDGKPNTTSFYYKLLG
jgi:GNAT superfamily N-acetyltransferase